MSDEVNRVLIIDDERAHAQAVAESLDRAGYECTVAGSGAEGLMRLQREDYALIITDLVMSDIDGFGILKETRRQLPDAEVIVVTGHATIPTAVEAMQQGAANYLTKPLDLLELRTVVQKAMAHHHLKRANQELQRQLNDKFGFEGVIGNASSMRKVIEQLKLVAPSQATVLILGESGTGKELVARALHNNSPRKNKPFVALDCNALNESLLESELFGHEAHSYTGAGNQPRKGRFEFADGGSLFLDELGDMPMTIQTKLLRVLESREVTRLGSNMPIKVNVRLISATHRPLEQMVEQGTFRRDLYYRLRVVTIHLPALRERREDIPLLCDHFLRDFSKLHDRPLPTISRPALGLLQSYAWPGNVREIRNVLESAFVMDTDGRIDLEDLPEDILQSERILPTLRTQDSLLGRPLDEVEAYYIEQALKLSQGNREEAARLLQISERTLYRKIKSYNIPSPRGRSGDDFEVSTHPIKEEI